VLANWDTVIGTNVIGGALLSTTGCECPYSIPMNMTAPASPMLGPFSFGNPGGIGCESPCIRRERYRTLMPYLLARNSRIEEGLIDQLSRAPPRRALQPSPTWQLI
jgi:hypothetical protein